MLKGTWFVLMAWFLPSIVGWTTTVGLPSLPSQSSFSSNAFAPIKPMPMAASRTIIPPGASSTSRNQSTKIPPTSSPHIHILILPGFGMTTEDYTKTGSLAPNLGRRFAPNQIHVLPVTSWDWLRTLGGGATDLEFLRGRASPDRKAYCWYLQKVAKEIQSIQSKYQQAHATTQKVKIILVGHSAGGWLARYVTSHSPQF